MSISPEPAEPHQPPPTDPSSPAAPEETAGAAAPAPPAGELATAPPPRLKPVAGGERVASVDVLRGLAVLGILAMNIYAFAMPFAAYSSPRLYGGDSGLDLATWVFTHLFFEQKFMSVFSILFGAGLVLMSRRAEERGTKFAGIYYRRQLWLLVFGAAHGYLLWFGDILFNYAVCGLLLYPFRRLSPKVLLALGLAAVAVASPLGAAMGFHMADLSRRAAAVEAALAAGEEIGDEQRAVLEEWREMKPMMDPDPAEIQRQVEIHRGGYLEIARERAPTVFMMQTVMMLFFGLWRPGGLMLVGMGLMKLGVLSARRSPAFYRRLLVAGYGLGLPLAAFSAYDLHAHGFDGLYLFKYGSHANYFGSVLVALGHIAVIMLLVQSGALRAFQDRLAAVGRMALTNYLAQTVVCTTLFYGYGLGLFGFVSRFEQMGFVVALWLLQLAWSPWWLARFRFGPAEWLWRTLAYWRAQPLRRREVTA